jgi:hypothetical protein
LQRGLLQTLHGEWVGFAVEVLVERVSIGLWFLHAD